MSSLVQGNANPNRNTIHTQIKLFTGNSMEEVELSVNIYLKKNHNRIIVKDVRFSTAPSSNTQGYTWNVMVVYETK